MSLQNVTVAPVHYLAAAAATPAVATNFPLHNSYNHDDDWTNATTSIIPPPAASSSSSLPSLPHNSQQHHHHHPPPPPTIDSFAAAAAIAAIAAGAPPLPADAAAAADLDRCHPYNPRFNCTAREYLLFSRGPQTVPLAFLLPVTVLYASIFIAGCVGNVLVCWVIVRHPAMHTATNYYLFSLSLSDLMYLLAGLPYDLSLFWWQYPYVLGGAVCKLRALISEAATYVSVLTITAFSTERYLAICHPLYVHTMGGLGRAARIVAALWTVSFASALPFAVYSEISYVNYPPWDESSGARIEASAFCAMLDNPPGLPLWELSSFCFFVLPMTLMVLLYGRMGWAIRRRSRQAVQLGVMGETTTTSSRRHNGGGGGGGSVRSEVGGGGAGQARGVAQSRKTIIRMLAAVCLTFFVSWAPFHAQRLMFLYAHDWEDYELLNVWLFSVAGLFYYVSCTVNPVLYNVMSRRYRRAFKETLFGNGGAGGGHRALRRR